MRIEQGAMCKMLERLLDIGEKQLALEDRRHQKTNRLAAKVDHLARTIDGLKTRVGTLEVASAATAAA